MDNWGRLWKDLNCPKTQKYGSNYPYSSSDTFLILDQSDGATLSGDALLAPNPSPTEGVSSPNRPNTPSDNSAAAAAVLPPYVFRPGDNISQTAAATSAALLMAGAAPNAYNAMTAEQIMTLNSNATTNRTTQTAALPTAAMYSQSGQSFGVWSMFSCLTLSMLFLAVILSMMAQKAANPRIQRIQF